MDTVIGGNPTDSSPAEVIFGENLDRLWLIYCFIYLFFLLNSTSKIVAHPILKSQLVSSAEHFSER